MKHANSPIKRLEWQRECEKKRKKKYRDSKKRKVSPTEKGNTPSNTSPTKKRDIPSNASPTEKRDTPKKSNIVDKQNETIVKPEVTPFWEDPAW